MWKNEWQCFLPDPGALFFNSLVCWRFFIFRDPYTDLSLIYFCTIQRSNGPLRACPVLHVNKAETLAFTRISVSNDGNYPYLSMGAKKFQKLDFIHVPGDAYDK
jgi:hypothetical protein